MSSRGWKLAPVLAVTALLSAGCDDSSNNNTQDLSIPGGDMAKAGADMTATPPDLLPAKGQGFILAADVVGNAWRESAPDGGETQVSLVHSLAAAVQLPELAGKSTYTDFFTNGSTVIHGCTANRYSPTNLPNPDTLTAGTVSITGYNNKVVMPTGATTAYSPAATIACVNLVTPLPNYACLFGGTTPVSGKVFPALTTGFFGFFCSASGGCLPTDCQDIGGGTCEQKLFVNGNVISIAVAGQAAPGYGASLLKWGVGFTPDGGVNGSVPAALTVTKILSGTTEITPASFDSITALDPAQDLTIEFSCDGTNVTGAGCSTGAGLFDLAILSGQTSSAPRQRFSNGTVPNTPNFGTLTCIEQRSAGTTKFTVNKLALQAMLGSTTGGGGSINFAAISAKATLGNGQTSLQAAGRGSFGFANVKP